MRSPAACIRATIRNCWPLLILAVAVTSLGAHPRHAVPYRAIEPTADRHTAASPHHPRRPIGVHSMLYLNTPFSAMKAMFKQAAAMGASEIRLDIELSAVFPGADRRRQRGDALSTLLQRPFLRRIGSRGRQPRSRNPLAHPNWSGVDEYMRLAHRYHLHVLADLTATPPDMADCPSGTPSRESYRCPPRRAREWGRAVGEIAAHSRGVIGDFEILNEPDGHWSFLGSPQQYAAVLAASYDAVHAANPTARVALGGLVHIGPRGRQWMDAVLGTQGADAVHKFDVANIHLRLPPPEVADVACGWKAYFSSKGFRGPLWVTETGYPAARAAQTDSGYQDGMPSQARWLANVIPAMLADGIAKIFVTERDLGRGVFASEGLLDTPDPLPPHPTIKRRPSFYAVQRLAKGGWITSERSYARGQSRTAGGVAAGC